MASEPAKTVERSGEMSASVESPNKSVPSVSNASSEGESNTEFKVLDIEDMSESQPTKERNEAKQNMITRLAQTDAHFKHQQRGDPDLSKEEKENIALDILQKSPAKFLERFSKYLIQEDVKIFLDMKGDYVVEFYLKEISKRRSDTRHNIVKNRRYQALQSLMDEGEYFSHNEMKWRDPLLFEQMVGQYETQAEQDEREVDMNDLKFSSILFKNMDANLNRKLYEHQKEIEECQDEEEEESSDEEDMESNEESEADEDEKSPKLENDESKVSDIDKAHLRDEFLQIMQERFLSGGDKNFDYSAVDDNADYDALDILGHDAEEQYFDADDPESGMSQDSGDMSDKDSCAVLCANSRTQPGDPQGCGTKSSKEVSKGEELDIRSGFKGMELKENVQDEEVEDYMSYEPSEELVLKSKESFISDS